MSSEAAGLTRPATLRDIARLCNVTTATVSRALRDPQRHSAELTQRIVDAAVKLGYDPQANNAARQLSSKRHGRRSLGYLVATIFPYHFVQAPYFLLTFEGIIDELTKDNFGVLMLKTPNQPGYDDSFIEPPRLLNRSEIDAIIVQNSGFSPETIAAAKWAKRPIISIFDGDNSDMLVAIDYIQASELILDHLLSLGHKRFIYLHKDMCQDRWNKGKHGLQFTGLLQALAKNNLDSNALVSFSIDKNVWLASFGVSTDPTDKIITSSKWPKQHRIGDFLRSNPDITAIIAPNDTSAILHCQILRECGFDIPADISIVAFENSTSHYPDRSILTCIKLPLYEIGQTTGKLLRDNLLAGVELPKTVNLPASILIAGSTAIRKKH